MQLMTADGVSVIVPMDHLKQHSDVLEHLDVAIGQIQTTNRNIIKSEIDMGRIIGVTDCVETTKFDDIIYAKREGRAWNTRFVLDREPEPCSHVTVVMKKSGSQYRLLTAYIGRVAEKEPDDLSIYGYPEYIRSKQFWDTHALVWGRQEVVQ